MYLNMGSFVYLSMHIGSLQYRFIFIIIIVIIIIIIIIIMIIIITCIQHIQPIASFI